MDLSTLSLNDLKALAYDQFGALELAQNNLRILNAEIEKRVKTPAPIETPITETAPTE